MRRVILGYGVALLIGVFSSGSASAALPVASDMPSADPSISTLPTYPTPVLSVDAGVLPTSPFYVLDRADEWVQDHVFSFGIPLLRAQLALSRAAERVAELQALNDQGLRTDGLTERLLRDHLVSLVQAADTAGRQYVAGKRPVALTQAVVRTLRASTDALRSLLIGDTMAGENPAGEGQDGRVLMNEHDQVMAALFPPSASVPPQVLRMVAGEELAQATRDVETSRNVLLARDGQEMHTIGAEALMDRATDALSTARTTLSAEDPSPVFALLSDVRTVNALLQSPRLLRAETAKSAMSSALLASWSAGLLSNAERDDALKNI